MEKPPDRVPHAGVPDASLVGSRSGTGRLLIRVSAGSGSRPTRLAAFDSALFAAGAAGYDIVRLSAVVVATYGTARWSDLLNSEG